MSDFVSTINIRKKAETARSVTTAKAEKKIRGRISQFVISSLIVSGIILEDVSTLLPFSIP